MIWSYFSIRGLFTGEYNFAGGIWRAERSLLKLTRNSGESDVSITVLPMNVNFTCDFDKNGDLLLDFTDYFASAPIGTPCEIVINFPLEDESYNLSASIVGDLSPRSMIIPHASNNEFVRTLQGYVPILPPTKFYKPLFGLYLGFALYNNNLEPVEWSANGVNWSAMSGGVSSISPNSNAIILRVNEGGVYSNPIRYEAQELLCRRYALVRWIGALGALKQHTFEVVSIKNVTDNAISIANPYGIARALKSQGISFNLRLSALTPYDYWYYSDIITSSSVRVALIEEDASFGDETIVEVITKELTMIDSGVKDFEISVKYREYETI